MFNARASLARPIRIEPAFNDRAAVRTLFTQHAPYRAAAAYLPDGSADDGKAKPVDSVLPWFRETWALGGKGIVTGAEQILTNPRFLAAARRLFPSAHIVAKTVVVNVNAPMPSGVPHVDVPSFRGATRERFPLRMLIAMGASGLFEPWRIVEAGAISWFYDGPGGGFDYWPDGLDGAMCTEPSPFGNIAIVADSDRMYHRIGEVGDGSVPLPRMTAMSEIHPETDGSWIISEGGSVRARYAPGSVRLSVLWKAEIVTSERGSKELGPLTPEQVSDIFASGLRQRHIAFQVPLDPLIDADWTDLLYKTFA